MLAVAAELDRVGFFLADFAAVLAVGAALGHQAAAGRMRAFGRVSHRKPPAANLRLVMETRKPKRSAAPEKMPEKDARKDSRKDARKDTERGARRARLG
jgi:hypothetical protein